MRDLEDTNNRNTKISFNLFNFLCLCSVRLTVKLNIDIPIEALTTFEYREHLIVSLPEFSHAQKHSVLYSILVSRAPTVFKIVGSGNEAGPTAVLRFPLEPPGVGR